MGVGGDPPQCINQILPQGPCGYGGHMVHEEVIIEGKVARASGVIFHRGEKCIEDKAKKVLLYASLRAQERREKGKKGAKLKMVFAFPFAFFRSYI